MYVFLSNHFYFFLVNREAKVLVCLILFKHKQVCKNQPKFKEKYKKKVNGRLFKIGKYFITD